MVLDSVARMSDKERIKQLELEVERLQKWCGQLADMLAIVAKAIPQPTFVSVPRHRCRCQFN
jgi:hypothetical protein